MILIKKNYCNSYQKIQTDIDNVCSHIIDNRLFEVGATLVWPKELYPKHVNYRIINGDDCYRFKDVLYHFLKFL